MTALAFTRCTHTAGYLLLPAAIHFIFLGETLTIASVYLGQWCYKYASEYASRNWYHKHIRTWESMRRHSFLPGPSPFQKSHKRIIEGIYTNGIYTEFKKNISYISSLVVFVCEFFLSFWNECDASFTLWIMMAILNLSKRQNVSDTFF